MVTEEIRLKSLRGLALEAGPCRPLPGEAFLGGILRGDEGTLNFAATTMAKKVTTRYRVVKVVRRETPDGQDHKWHFVSHTVVTI